MQRLPPIVIIVVAAFAILAGVGWMSGGHGITFAQLPMGTVSVDARYSNGNPYPSSFTVNFINPFGGAGSGSVSHGQSMAVPAGTYAITSISPAPQVIGNPLSVPEGGTGILSAVFPGPTSAQPPTCSNCGFDPTTIIRGNPTNFNWNVSGSPSPATRYELNCNGDIGVFNGNNPPAQGSVAVRPRESQTCTIRLWNVNGQYGDYSSSVTVNMPPVPVVPQTRNFTAEIANVANAPLAVQSRAAITVYGPGGSSFAFHDFEVIHISAMGSTPVSYSIPAITPTAETQTYRVRLVVDATNAVPEVNEDNNIAETTFSIAGVGTNICPPGQCSQTCPQSAGTCSAPCGGGTQSVIDSSCSNRQVNCNTQACPTTGCTGPNCGTPGSGTPGSGTPGSGTPGSGTPDAGTSGPTGPGAGSGQSLAPPGDGGSSGAPPSGTGGGTRRPPFINPRIWEVLPRF